MATTTTTITHPDGSTIQSTTTTSTFDDDAPPLAEVRPDSVTSNFPLESESVPSPLVFTPIGRRRRSARDRPAPGSKLTAVSPDRRSQNLPTAASSSSSMSRASLARSRRCAGATHRNSAATLQQRGRRSGMTGSAPAGRVRHGDAVRSAVH